MDERFDDASSSFTSSSSARGGGGAFDEYALGCRPFASLTPCRHSKLNEHCEAGKIDYLAFYFCTDEINDYVPAFMNCLLYTSDAADE